MPLRETIESHEACRLARGLAGRLSGFRASALVYLMEGGRAPGLALAEELGLPARGLDIRYPLSRTLDAAPRWLRPPALAVKELAYRLTEPRPAGPKGEQLPSAGDRVVLFDDSASSGRTIRAALGILAARGIPRESVQVVVLRCGGRARPLVDHFAISRRVTFVR